MYVRVRKVFFGGSREFERGIRRVGRRRKGLEVGFGRVESGMLGLGLKIVKKVGLWGLEMGLEGMKGAEMSVFRVGKCMKRVKKE